MRSVVLSIAVLAASALAYPVKECTRKVNKHTTVQYVDLVVTKTVYVTETAPRTKHAAPKPKATTVVYVPPPVETPAYQPPVYNAPAPSPKPAPKPSPVPVVVPAPAPAPVSPAPVGDDQKCLETHNKFRAAHGAKALVWSKELAAHAEANTGDCTMHHSGGPYGENLAFGYDSVEAAITAWYEEKNQYNAASPGFQMSTGHFTQLIWKATSEIGCYNRKCGGSQYLMCEYRTPGNVVGNNGQYFTENVQM
ncbi:hypothetical protein TWF569_004118 [Orbilia oligospora]|uniref:SCP domain-containing protein n=1 Tax=Orbilia oligospora TaxID=2813651 RepID=A0A7C8NU96_ORBOL|nr:hypothetical protein TWF706_011289 [Orbilia oligospora]KAF3094891.1 hypothetical protein TWF103_010394 [Orbilia oligospora]KAF3095539.1 hypothetical protein TWF102_007251 [Orbilia oligospora]KAF3134747.1 hypothetical protein TWF594_008671 [Orbilia oligospora]KAF3137593.1 hypothetical protein TWF703_005018 [Orbilia oligospora]